MYLSFLNISQCLWGAKYTLLILGQKESQIMNVLGERSMKTHDKGVTHETVITMVLQSNSVTHHCSIQS